MILCNYKGCGENATVYLTGFVPGGTLVYKFCGDEHMQVAIDDLVEATNGDIDLYRSEM